MFLPSRITDVRGMTSPWLQSASTHTHTCSLPGSDAFSLNSSSRNIDDMPEFKRRQLSLSSANCQCLSSFLETVKSSCFDFQPISLPSFS